MTAASTRIGSSIIPLLLHGVEVGVQANGMSYLVDAAAAMLLLLLLPPLIKTLEQHYAPVLQAMFVRSQRLAPRVGHQYILAWGRNGQSKED